MNSNWNCSFWELVIRLIQLLLIGALIIIALRLMAWADTGSRGECPVEESVIPIELRP